MWIAYALLASVSFGTAAILQKLAAIGTKVHTSAWEVLIFQGLATIVVGLVCGCFSWVSGISYASGGFGEFVSSGRSEVR